MSAPVGSFLRLREGLKCIRGPQMCGGQLFSSLGTLSDGPEASDALWPQTPLLLSPSQSRDPGPGS